MTASEKRDISLIVILGMLSAIGPLSIDTYLPSMPTIAADFGATSAAVQQSLSAFFLGLAGGQLIWGPLSDRFGRRPALFFGFGLYLLASVACALAGDVEWLIVARAIQGLGAAATPAAGRAIIRDVWTGNKAARAMSFVVLVMSVAPLLAPILGGQILLFFGWRVIFWMLCLLAVACVLLVLWRLPETNGPEKRAGVSVMSAFRAYGKVLADVPAWGYLICGGMLSAAMFAYIASAASVYIEHFEVDPQFFGFYFALNALGMTAGNYLNGRLVMRYGFRRLLGVGIAVSLVSVLILAAITATGHLTLLTLVIFLFFAVSMVGLVGANAMAGLLTRHGKHAGAAAALFGLFQFGLGAIAGSVSGAFYHGGAMAMVAVMTGASLLALIAYGVVRRLDAPLEEQVN